MRILFVIVLVVGIMAGCKKGRTKIPSDVISPDKMQWVIWDMIRADQFATSYILNRDSTLDKIAERTRLYEKIFEIHKIDQQKFQKSFSFYREHPDLFKKMMDSLNVRINRAAQQPSSIVDTTVTKPITQPLAPTQ